MNGGRPLLAGRDARRFTLLAAESTTPEADDQLRGDVQRLALAYPLRPFSVLIGYLPRRRTLPFLCLSAARRRSRPGNCTSWQALPAGSWRRSRTTWPIHMRPCCRPEQRSSAPTRPIITVSAPGYEDFS